MVASIIQSFRGIMCYKICGYFCKSCIEVIAFYKSQGIVANRNELCTIYCDYNNPLYRLGAQIRAKTDLPLEYYELIDDYIRAIADGSTDNITIQDLDLLLEFLRIEVWPSQS